MRSSGAEILSEMILRGIREQERNEERARIVEVVRNARVYVDSGDLATDTIADIATERFRRIILAAIDGGDA